MSNSKNIFVVGSLNADYVVGVRNFPKGGETLKSDSFAIIPGGKGANQAVACARAGGNTKMIGAVGNDDLGTMMLHTVGRSGVDTHNINRINGEVTGMAFITIDGTGENQIIIIPGANNRVTFDMFFAGISKSKPGDYVLLQREIPEETNFKILDYCREQQLVSVLNTAPAPDTFLTHYSKIDIVIANEHEIYNLTHIEVTNVESANEAANKLHNLGIETVIVTLGKNGAFYSNGTFNGLVAAPEVQVIDTTGAGDTFTGYLVASLSNGLNLADAVKLAVNAASLSVTIKGAIPSIPHSSAVKLF